MLGLFIALLSLSVGNVSSPFLSENIAKNNEYLSFSSNGDGTYLINSLLDNELKEYRLYSSYQMGEQEYLISGISDTLFNNVTSPFSIMISNGIANYSSNLFNNENITHIHFTGSQNEWNNHQIETSINVSFYSFDEGFINYWNEYVRKESDSDICSMSKEEYQILKDKYDALSAEDKMVVNAYSDKAGDKIEDTMDYLAKYYSEQPSSETKTKSNLPQDMTLGIIISIAIFGMTTISIFYILKKQGIIN